MTGDEARPTQALGFLTVLEHEQQGFVGGYLVLNTSGRPLEFHCTAPIKPNRAQQILFGPTLQPYLYGEQIGQTLLAKGSIEPLALWTDVEQVLSVRDFIAWPVGLVLAGDMPPNAAGQPSAERTWRVDAAHRPGAHLNVFELGRNRVAVGAGRDADRTAIIARLEGVAMFDLNEPFERIREAVEEAHKQSRA